MTNPYDVIVVGGGPSGATTAGLLAKWGRRVLLLEKEKFPRYHIGESLIPGVWPVIKELGAEQELENLGAQRKHGVTLVWGPSPEPWDIRFDEIATDAPVVVDGTPVKPNAFEVKRAEFDNMLLTHARRQGAVVMEETTVREVVFEGERCVGVRYARAHSDEVAEVRAPLVIDASGQSKLLARRFDSVEWHSDLKNLAVWTYFQGGSRYPGENAGNILVEACPPGWLWMIPFSDGSCSVGYVAPAVEFSKSGMTPAELLRQRIASTGEISRLTSGAVEVAQTRTAKDWSYTSTRMTGPGFLQVGDAAAFIDPLFSTGVMLAMKGASLVAHAADRILNDPGTESQLMSGYEKDYHEVLDVVIDFVRFFYDQNRPVEEYFEKAQGLIDPEQARKAREDFITLVSGLAKAVEGWQLD